MQDGGGRARGGARPRGHGCGRGGSSSVEIRFDDLDEVLALADRSRTPAR